jgi:hypothetical protein
MNRRFTRLAEQQRDPVALSIDGRPVHQDGSAPSLKS